MRYLIDKRYTHDKRFVVAEGLSTELKPTTGLITGSVFTELDTGARYKYDETGKQWLPESKPSEVINSLIAERLAGITRALNNPAALESRISTLDETPLANGTVVEAVGVPVYVSESDLSTYSAYSLTDTGWYIFARVAAPSGVTVGEGTTVTGAAGAIITENADHVDIAVKFDVAAQSKPITIDWGESEDHFVFKATDLAVRNLDYRTTFYVYDLAEFVTWEYGLTADAAFVGTAYYTEDNGVYTQAAVKAEAAVTADTYYTHAYALTEDATFVDGKTYYTKDGDNYSVATVTAGEAVTANTYYEDKYTLTTDKTFVGSKYYTKDGSTYTQAAVKAGEAPGTPYYEHSYELTADETFQSGKTYYTEEGGVYTQATVTPGDAVTPDTYYEDVYTLTTDSTFDGSKTYYTKSGDTYTEATVTASDPVPTVYYAHTKLIIQGMTRNITYRLDEIVDCPSEVILPAIEDDTHGCWFEFQLQHSGKFSMTLTPPEGVKIATEHTQAEDKGFNLIDLHYMDIGGVKMWRFMNTHSSIPA